MSIRLKIFLACLSLTAITIAFGLLARASQAELGGLAFRLYDDAFMSMSYLRSAQNELLAVSGDLVAPTAESQPVIADKIETALSDLQVAHDRALSPQGAEAAAWLQEQVALLQEQIRSGRPADRQHVAQVEDRFDTAVEINAGDGFRSRRDTVKVVAQLEMQTWTIMGVSVAVALTITMLLSRAIVPSVRDAVRIATNIASGHLDNPIKAVGSGETAVLLRALDTMQRSIADKMSQINALLAMQATSHASEIAAQHLRFEVALDNMVQGLCMLNEERRIMVHNRRFGEMFADVDAGDLLAKALPAPLLTQDKNEERQPRLYTRTLDDGRAIAVSERPMSAGGWVVTYEDVTERHRSEARMAHIARHDSLTGLPNRLLFHEQMQVGLADPRRAAGTAILCLNLDHFKSVNDTLGHPVGDGLLCEVATRLFAEAGEGDTVVRLGGDEFGIIQHADAQPAGAKKLAERVLAAVAKPFEINGNKLSIGASIGIAVHGHEPDDADGLLQKADLALDRAKLDGRGTYRFFEAEMDALMQARRLLEIDLRMAVDVDQFEVHYQPLITAATKQISGFEALVRWRHPTRGMVSPAEFIPVAEETGLIGRLGALVLERACVEALTWPDTIKVAVNLSPLQFRNPHLAADVADVLRRTGLPPSRLELEVTELVLLQDGDTIMAILHDIRTSGVRISMDDFGTGYSSLSYLRRFPFDKIKIDQSFIRTLEDSDDCLAIVRAVLGLGRSLGMRVVAEGVETEEQYALLHREGCEQLQGYLFSKPQPASAVGALIARYTQQEAA